MPAFESFLTQEKGKPKKWLRITITASVGLHAALLVAGVVYSFWHVEELTPPNVTVTFLSAAPTPPPPPPPAKKKKNTVVKKPVEIVQPRPSQIVQPREKPPEPEEEDDGVEGGVEGGVAGGVVGSTGPVTETPKMLPPNIAKSQLLIDPQSDQYRPKLPPALNRAGARLFAMVKVCVKKDGGVESANIIKSADALVDPEIVAKVRTWKYKPYAIDGRPVPFCFMLRLDLAAQ